MHFRENWGEVYEKNKKQVMGDIWIRPIGYCSVYESGIGDSEEEDWDEGLSV